MKRRTVLAACCATVAGAASAGCLSTGSTATGDEDATEDTDATGDAGTPGDEGTGAPPESTSTSTLVQAANTPDPDHEVRLRNDDDRSHAVTLTVTGPDGATVHRDTYELAPAGRTLAYDLKRADPDGVRAFDLTFSLGERSETVTVETSECYGDVRAAVSEDGKLDVTYAIC